MIKRRPVLELAGVMVSSFLYLTWLQYHTPYVLETDGYFHAKVSYLIRTQGILKSFPWVTQSLWVDEYFDKDFLYHVILAAFMGGDLVWGAKAGAITFGTIFFGSFYLVMRLGGSRWAAVWAILLLVGSGPAFGWRVGVTRPQVWSMTLSVWALFFALRSSRSGVFVVSTVYALSYTAPHLAIGYSGIFASLSWLDGRFRTGTERSARFPTIAGFDLGLPLAAGFGVLLGWCIHPHYPASFHAFKVQVIDVLASAWTKGGPNLRLGGEISPPPFGSFFVDNAVALLGLVVGIAAMVRRRRRPDAKILTLWAVTLVFFGLTLLSRRFIEYCAPFMVWTAAAMLHDFEAPHWRDWTTRVRMGVAVVALALGVFLVRSVRSHEREFNGPKAPVGEPFAKWLVENTPENSIVFTCDWDETPELFFFNHHNRYLVFLDPNFMYRWKPEVWKLWDATVFTRAAERPSRTILEQFGAKYGFCSADFSALKRRFAADDRVRIVLENEHGYLFTIDR